MSISSYPVRLAILCFMIAPGFGTILCAGQQQPLRFDVEHAGAPAAEIARIEPWKIVPLDPEYGGQWVVARDLDGDGAAEIVSAENFNEGDVHFTSTAVAQKLDGSVLWRWGDPSLGRKIWHHDVACQIHDWDGDGRNEVILCTKGFLVELDGATGRERRKIPIAEDATDCLVFCNLSGGPHPSDVLVKNRYRQIWAYDRSGRLLWTVTDPGGYRTAHQPRPMDLDGDGRDEIFAGYAMLNADGSVRWTFKSQRVDQTRGHLDCARIVRRGKRPEDFRLALTCCGANNMALVNGAGKVLWEVAGYHYESVDIGRIFPDVDGPQLLVDIDHRPLGESPLCVLDEQGNLLGRIVTDYSRHHGLLDWTGDGVAEIIVAHHGCMYDHRGRCIGVFNLPGGTGAAQSKGERSLLIGEMTGDGIRDVMIATPQNVYIYANSKGVGGREPAPLGTEFNFTLY